MADRERNREKFTGRAKGHSFLALPHYMIESPQFEALSGNALKLLLEVAKQFRGNNNGDLSIPWSYLKPRGWTSQTTVQRAKEELLGAGWLVCTRHGYKKICSLYAVTWLPIDDVPHSEIAKERKARNTWKNEITAPVSGVHRSRNESKGKDSTPINSRIGSKSAKSSESFTPETGFPSRSSTKRQRVTYLDPEGTVQEAA